MEHHILQLSKTMLIRINSQYLAAATVGKFDNDTIIGWFNNQPFHTAPLTLNLIHNAVVRAVLDKEHSIRVINAPLPFTIESRLSLLTAGNNIGFQLATNIGFAMAFVAAFYVMFYVKVI